MKKRAREMSRRLKDAGRARLGPDRSRSQPRDTTSVPSGGCFATSRRRSTRTLARDERTRDRRHTLMIEGDRRVRARRRGAAPAVSSAGKVSGDVDGDDPAAAAARWSAMRTSRRDSRCDGTWRRSRNAALELNLVTRRPRRARNLVTTWQAAERDIMSPEIVSTDFALDQAIAEVAPA